MWGLEDVEIVHTLGIHGAADGVDDSGIAGVARHAQAEDSEFAFVRGLIDSDGCRITANYRERNGTRRRYGRYVFSNRSEDLHRLFTDSLDALDIHWTRANQYDTAVARQRDVRRLDDYIGWKA